MKVSARYILLAMPLLLVACEKDIVAPSQSGDNYIRIGVGMAETRARMGAADLKNANTKLTVYGYDGTDTPVFDGLTATPPSQQSGQSGAISISNWVIKDGNTELKPEWVDGRDYTFFAWTQQDASGKAASGTGGLFSAGFTYTKETGADTATEDDDAPAMLTIAATTLPIDDGIMDFCYSNVETRSTSTTATNRPNYSMIQLDLEHLFSGFSLSAHNYTAQDIVITSIKLSGIYNRKSAVIYFYTDPDKGVITQFNDISALSAEELVTDAGGVTVAANSAVQNVAKGSGDDAKYFLMWPQTKEQIEDATLTVSYTIGGVAKTPVTLQIPGDEVENDTDFSWPAGVCRNIELSFMNKSLKLTMKPIDWNQIETSIDYTSMSSVTAGLEFDANTCIIDDVNHIIYFKGGIPIEATFKIDQPANGSWLVSKSGDFDAFEVDNITEDIGTGVPGDGEDTLEGIIIPDKQARISITPAIASPERDYTMQLRFSTRSNSGQVTDINSAMQTVIYTIVLLKK